MRANLEVMMCPSGDLVECSSEGRNPRRAGRMQPRRKLPSQDQRGEDYCTFSMDKHSCHHLETQIIASIMLLIKSLLAMTQG